MEEQTTLGETKVSYHIKTEHFEGPLDLLLSLIEKRKLFINDFSLAKVADDYISHIRQFETFPTNEVANFLIVASTLVLIKSKSILPALDLTREEESDIDDLKRRLFLYDLYRRLSNQLKIQFGKNIIYERSDRPDMIPVFTPTPQITQEQLHLFLKGVIAGLPKKTIVPKAVIKKVISIEEMMTRLIERVTHTLKISFGQFSRYEKGKKIEKEERVDVIVSFLAMLELVKQGIVHVSQNEHDGDITIETHNFGTPQYT